MIGDNILNIVAIPVEPFISVPTNLPVDYCAARKRDLTVILK